MPEEEALYSDVIITWLGAAGVWGYVNFVLHNRTSSTLERNTLFLLYCALALLIVRGFQWLLAWPWLTYIRYLPVALLPLAVVLFGESLMRRHINLPMKVYVAAGTVVFVFLALFDLLREQRALLVSLAVFELSVIVLTGWMVWRTERSKLTSSESRLIGAVFVAAMVSVPLILTDYRDVFSWIPRRFGSAAPLILVYVLVRLHHRADTVATVFREVIGMFVRASVVALSFMAISGNLVAREFLEFLPLSLVLVLVFTIFYRLKAVSVENRGVSFLQWLLHAKMSSFGSFVNSLRRLPLMREHLLLLETDLRDYDVQRLLAYLGKERRILSLTQLRQQAASESRGREVAEELVSLLEKHGMSHVGLASRQPASLLLLNSPLVPGAHFEEVKVNVILKLCRVLQRTDSGREELTDTGERQLVAPGA
ncbi:MAG: hypothetical protein ACREU7_11770 [Burkholderiales bacterium]